MKRRPAIGLRGASDRKTVNALPPFAIGGRALFCLVSMLCGKIDDLRGGVDPASLHRLYTRPYTGVFPFRIMLLSRLFWKRCRGVDSSLPFREITHTFAPCRGCMCVLGGDRGKSLHPTPVREKINLSCCI